MNPPKYESKLKGISVREVEGIEVIITPQGLELIGRTGEGILGCAHYNGDTPFGIPRKFKKKLVADSRKGRLYIPYFSDDVILKFYKREKLAPIDRILIESGMDQLEAAYFINENTGFHSPTPFFASIDVLCMENVVDMMTCENFISLNPEKKEEIAIIIEQFENELLKKGVSTSAGANNFYMDHVLFKITGKIKINPFDQKYFFDSQYQRDERWKYLDKRYGLGVFE